LLMLAITLAVVGFGIYTARQARKSKL
jgi:hypothetical protein